MAYVIVIKLNYYYPSDYPISCCPLLKFRSFEIIIILFLFIYFFSIFNMFSYVLVGLWIILLSDHFVSIIHS